jgi:hypothetical protein
MNFIICHYSYLKFLDSNHTVIFAIGAYASLFVVLGLVSNAEMTEIIREDVLRLHADTIPLCMKDLHIHGFQYTRESGTTKSEL